MHARRTSRPTRRVRAVQPRHNGRGQVCAKAASPSHLVGEDAQAAKEIAEAVEHACAPSRRSQRLLRRAPMAPTDGTTRRQGRPVTKRTSTSLSASKEPAMAEVNANNVANVSSTKGVKGGYIFTAPANTPLPTDYKTQLPQQWKCLGFISEDGYTETLDTDSEDLKDMNGDLMGSPQTSRVESGQFTLAEIKRRLSSDVRSRKRHRRRRRHHRQAQRQLVRHMAHRARTGAQGRSPLAQGRAYRTVLRARRPHARGGRACRPCAHGQVPDRRERQHLLRLHPIHRDHGG